MSVCTFIAADICLSEIKNPHYKMLSINEALDMGLEIDQSLLDGEIDKNAPDVILWSDFELFIDNKKVFDGNAADNFALLTMNDTLQYCDKLFGVYIEWHYFTEERAKAIIDYIRNFLTQTECIEIWNVWLSDYDPPKNKITTVNIKDLQPYHIKQIYEYNPWDNESIADTYGYDTPIHHCLRIVV
ncbi:MAG: hypothetical protein VB111_04855 [Clostridiaceae bacterium]|nr:hypothetical protein [Clostridiaceae bacterium]